MKDKEGIVSPPLRKILKEKLIVLNTKGLHTRPSVELVRCVQMFNVRITIFYQGYKASACSVTELLMLSATRNAVLDMEVEGKDAEKAIKAIRELAANRFYIDF